MWNFTFNNVKRLTIFNHRKNKNFERIIYFFKGIKYQANFTSLQLLQRKQPFYLLDYCTLLQPVQRLSHLQDFYLHELE